MSVSTELAEWICSVRLDDVPGRVLELSRAQIASVVAAMFASRSNASARAVRVALLRAPSGGRCSLVPGGERIGRDDAIVINSAHSMALDYDDYLHMGHTGHSAVLASLALGQAGDLDARDVLLAQVVANEVGGRVGASAVLGPQNGQAWSFIHAIEGAAVAAKLWRLTPRQTANAIGIALYQPTYTLWPGFMGPGSKVLTAAAPTVTGVQAAAFAREGLTGAEEIFEHPRKGFWASFSWAPLPQMMTGLGSAWVSDTLAFKRYPGCAYIDTTLDALFTILAEFSDKHGRPLGAGEVERIEVAANLLTVEMDNLSSEHERASERLSPINVNFSIPFNVAIAIVAGAHDGSTLTEPFLNGHEHEIRALAARTSLRHEWKHSFEVVRAFEGVLGRSGALSTLGPAQYLALLEGYRRQMGGRKRTSVRLGALLRGLGALPRARRGAARSQGGTKDLSAVDFTRFRMAFPVEVTLYTKDRERYVARQDVPVGAPGQAGRVEAAYAKLARELGPVLGAGGAAKVAERIRSFESSGVESLFASLGEPPR